MVKYWTAIHRGIQITQTFLLGIRKILVDMPKYPLDSFQILSQLVRKYYASVTKFGRSYHCVQKPLVQRIDKQGSLVLKYEIHFHICLLLPCWKTIHENKQARKKKDMQRIERGSELQVWDCNRSEEKEISYNWKITGQTYKFFLKIPMFSNPIPTKQLMDETQPQILPRAGKKKRKERKNHYNNHCQTNLISVTSNLRQKYEKIVVGKRWTASLPPLSECNTFSHHTMRLVLDHCFPSIISKNYLHERCQFSNLLNNFNLYIPKTN